MTVTYPGGTYRPLGPQTQPTMHTHEVICLHTMVGYLASTDTFFRDQGFGGTESHFGVGGRWGSDVAQNLNGVVWQWQDLDYTADANYEGNDRVISIETADNAPQNPADIEAWTPAQVDAIVNLVAWLCRRYLIPARLVPDTRPGTRGIAYHAQGTAASLPAGAERWSKTVGKPCPTARRIDQIVHVVIPRVQQQLDGAGGPVPLREDHDMYVAKVGNTTWLINPAAPAGQDRVQPLGPTELAAFGALGVPVVEGISPEHMAAIRSRLAAGTDVDQVLAAVSGVRGEVDAVEDRIVGRIEALPTSGFTDAQISTLSEQLGIDYDRIADAVRLDLGHALGND